MTLVYPPGLPLIVDGFKVGFFTGVGLFACHRIVRDEGGVEFGRFGTWRTKALVDRDYPKQTALAGVACKAPGVGRLPGIRP